MSDGWHNGRVQWHWGNIGAAVAGIPGGISALAVVATTIRYGPGFIRDRRENEQEQKKLAAEQVEALRLERRRHLSGWSSTGVNTYRVDLVTSEPERDAALKAVGNGGPSDYVILRVPGGPGSIESLRCLLREDPYLARRPTAGEIEALKVGLEAMDIPLAAYEPRPTGTAT